MAQKVGRREIYSPVPPPSLLEFLMKKKTEVNSNHIEFTSYFIDVAVNCGLQLLLISVH